MAIKEDLKPTPGAAGSEPPPPAEESPSHDAGDSLTEDGEDAGREKEDAQPLGSSSPAQLGTRRFVYAAYFAGAIAIGLLVSKLVDFAWYRAQNYKPAIGEPRDEIVMPLSGLVGALVAVYCWYRTRTRQLAEEVATEMSKVTWPSREEVTSGTFVVIVTTIISTVFFALMDKFWGFVSNLVYGGS
jgi:preprotein translocase subunit SecE